MIKVAITGNIASGKSEVEKILTNLGYKVFDADKIAHEILYNSQNVIDAFNEYDILENGNISREKLGQLVFNDEVLLQRLNSIIHPLVKSKILEIFTKYNDEKYIFVSIPLLFETGMEDLFDKVLLVYCNDTLRLERLIKRNGYTKEYAQKRIASQMSQDEKLKKVDFVVKNEDSIQYLRQQIFDLF